MKICYDFAILANGYKLYNIGKFLHFVADLELLSNPYEILQTVPGKSGLSYRLIYNLILSRSTPTTPKNTLSGYNLNYRINILFQHPKMRDESARKMIQMDAEGKQIVVFKCENCEKPFFTPAQLSCMYIS